MLDASGEKFEVVQGAKVRLRLKYGQYGKTTDSVLGLS